MSKPQKQTVFGPIMPQITHGQAYIDTPTWQEVPVYCGRVPMVGKTVRYYTRTPLRWVKAPQ